MTDRGRRTSSRIQAAFRVTYPSLDRLVVAYTQDLSRGGMFVKTDRFFPVSTVVRLRLTLPEGGGDETVIARVAYVRSPEEAESSGKTMGMGLQFLDLSRDAVQRIEEFIAASIGSTSPRDETEGADRPPAEAKSLRGDLSHVALSTMLSLLQMERMSGVLHVAAARTGKVYLREGRAVFAEVEPAAASPREAIFEILTWNQGQFEFVPGDVVQDDEINASVQALLLELGHRADGS